MNLLVTLEAGPEGEKLLASARVLSDGGAQNA
jgi:hypothetical protein